MCVLHKWLIAYRTRSGGLIMWVK